jgi:hypothetical protein
MSQVHRKKQAIEKAANPVAAPISQQQHMSQVPECPLCSAIFFTRRELEAHTIVVHLCALCPMRLLDEPARDRHLRLIHGKVERPSDRVRADEEVQPSFEQIPHWRSPLEGLKIPGDPEERCRWLYQFCLRIAAAPCPEAAWKSLPGELRDSALYVEGHFELLKRATGVARYRRLKSPESKAEFLSKALALPGHRPSYAEQKLGSVKCV